jgi:hypothetical protein
VTPCGAASSALDVILLLDQTGSNESDVTAMLPTLRSRLIAPLLGMSGVQVGLAYFGEFPVGGYGSSGDRPFEGGLEPGVSLTAIDTELASRPTFGGIDAPDSSVEALSMLSGGGTALAAVPMTCSSGRVLGGCWRSGARRMIVIFTDSAIHEGPDPVAAGVLFSPYAGISPAPATWTALRPQLSASGTLLSWIDTGAPSDGAAQFDRMLSELGQPSSDHARVGVGAGADVTQTGLACDAIVARAHGLAS